MPSHFGSRVYFVDCKGILTPILRTWVHKSTLLLQNRGHAEVFKKKTPSSAKYVTQVQPHPPPRWEFQSGSFLPRAEWLWDAWSASPQPAAFNVGGLAPRSSRSLDSLKCILSHFLAPEMRINPRINSFLYFPDNLFLKYSEIICYANFQHQVIFLHIVHVPPPPPPPPPTDIKLSMQKHMWGTKVAYGVIILTHFPLFSQYKYILSLMRNDH